MQKIKTIIMVVTAVISGAWGAWGIAGQIFSVPSTSSLSNPPWISIGIAFIIFVITVSIGWYSASQKLKNHEENHPEISLTPIIEGKYLYLLVKNIGHEKADFQIQILGWDGFTKDSSDHTCPK